MSGVRGTLRLAAAAWLALSASAALAQASPASFTSYTRYDAVHRVTGSFAPAPGDAGGYLATRNSYDASGRPWKVETGRLSAYQGDAVAPSAWSGFTIARTVEYGYDAMDRKTWERVYSPGVFQALTETSWERDGQVKCVAVRMNLATSPGGDACALAAPGSEGPDRITHNIYDGAGQLATVQRAYGSSIQQDYVKYEYSLTGKQKAVIDANGNRAELRYDAYDRESCWIFPSKIQAGALGGDCATGDFEAYGYDPGGNRTSLRKRDGTTIGYQYDALGRMTVKTVPASGSAAGYAVYYAYDLRGLQTEARFGSLSGAGVSNSYDGAGRPKTSTTNMDGTSKTYTSTYDADGDRLWLLGSGTSEYYAGWEYDSSDHMKTVREWSGVAVQIFYDTLGRRSSRVDTVWDVSSTTYGYDGAGRLNALTHNLSGTSADQVYGFGYNPASQMASRSSSNIAYASNTAYNVNRGYSVNGLNQYTASGGNALGYDANGNLMSDSGTTYVYDAENRLVSATAAGQTTTLAYDPLGRLWQVSGPAGPTSFTYDGDRLIEEYASPTWRMRAYFHGPGVDEPVLWHERNGGGWLRRFLHADWQGSIVSLADDLGNPVYIHGYDAWGIPNNYDSWNNAALPTRGRFGYTGQTWIPELGLWYYKARIYSPTLGRFLQTDPVGYADQVNLYAYVGNDPVDGRDPSGEMKDDCDSACQKRAAAIMGETSGLRPQVTKGKDGKLVADPQSSIDLRKGRAAIGIVSERGQRIHSVDASGARNPITKKQWRESVSAAQNPDRVRLPPEARQIFIRNEDSSSEKALARNLGDPKRETLFQSYGPFRSVGGGDVGKGDNIYIDIYEPRD